MHGYNAGHSSVNCILEVRTQPSSDYIFQAVRDGLERDPEEHALGLDLMGGDRFSLEPNKRGTRLRGDHAQKIS
jgi:hypothetical protein